MTEKELYKKMKEKANERLKENGFKISRGQLAKEVGEFKYYIDFGIVDLNDVKLASFHFGISSKSLSIIYKCLEPDRDLRKNQYYTVYGINQARLFTGSRYPKSEYEIRKEEDVIEMIDEFYEYYINQAYPFLSSISDLKKISGFMNYDENVKKQSAYLANTLKTSLILARLTEDPYYNKLKEEYRVLLGGWVEYEKKEFEKIIFFLDNNSPKELKEVIDKSKMLN